MHARVATRWIGDAFVLDGDVKHGAPAIFRGQCARVRIVDVSRDFEFGVDELLRHFAVGTVRGESVVERLATYRGEDVLALVDADVADVSLAALMERIEDAPSRVGLALFVARACVRAWQAATLQERVVVEMRPSRVQLAWDGGVLFHVAPAPTTDAWEWSDDPVDAVAFEAVFGHEERALGALLYSIIAGVQPFRVEDGEDFERARAVAERRDRNDHVDLGDVVAVPESVRSLVEGMLASTRRRPWELMAGAIDVELGREPYDARALSGLLEATFRDEKSVALREREDRLGVVPGPRVARADWALLDEDSVLDADDGGNLSGLWHAPEREPRVDAVDPFDDEG